MSGFCPQKVEVWINKVFGGVLRKTQVINLSRAVFGMVKKRSGIISELVRDTLIPGSNKHKHRRKRLDRFLANLLVKPEMLFGLWTCWVLKILATGKYIPIAIDWTTLPQGHQCLMAAIPFGGRAIPLMWLVLPSWESIKDSQNRIEERFISRLLNLLPNDKIPIVIADRGFGRTDLIKFLLKKGCCLSLGSKAKSLSLPPKAGESNSNSFLLNLTKQFGLNGSPIAVTVRFPASTWPGWWLRAVTIPGTW